MTSELAFDQQDHSKSQDPPSKQTTDQSIDQAESIITEFGFRVADRSSFDCLKLRNNPLIKFNQLNHHIPGKNADKWFSVGVICCKPTKKKSSKGTEFHSLRLIDQTVDLSISCCFFGTAAEAITKCQPGQLILIIEPTIVRSNALTANRSLKQVNQPTISLCVTKANQIAVIGRAIDFEQCAAIKPTGRDDPLFSATDQPGARCQNWFDSTRGVSNKPTVNQSANQSVNRSASVSHHTLCPQHYMASYRRAASSRPTVNRQTTVFGELMTAPAHPQARKRRKLG